MQSSPTPKKKRSMTGMDIMSHRGSPFGYGGFQGVDINIEDLFGGGFESIFGGIFGGRRSQGKSRGSDLLYRHNISFQEAFSGSEAEIEIEVMSVCDACDGSGALNPNDVEICTTCEGHGRLRRMQRLVRSLNKLYLSALPAMAREAQSAGRATHVTARSHKQDQEGQIHYTTGNRVGNQAENERIWRGVKGRERTPRSSIHRGKPWKPRLV